MYKVSNERVNAVLIFASECEDDNANFKIDPSFNLGKYVVS